MEAANTEGMEAANTEEVEAANTEQPLLENLDDFARKMAAAEGLLNQEESDKSDLRETVDHYVEATQEFVSD